MGRELAFYSFSMDTWRAQLAALPPAEQPSPEACPEGEEEPGDLTALVWSLLHRGQTPVPSPDAGRFWYALSQMCIGYGASRVGAGEIDGVNIAQERQARIVVRYLGQGRPLFGDRLDRHGIYGWLEHGDETSAFESLIASPAWAAYVAPGRYRQKAVPAFERGREIARAWAARCTAEGRDVFFSSYPIE
jgi:hypothetical protein